MQTRKKGSQRLKIKLSPRKEYNLSKKDAVLLWLVSLHGANPEKIYQELNRLKQNRFVSRGSSGVEYVKKRLAKLEKTGVLKELEESPGALYTYPEILSKQLKEAGILRDYIVYKGKVIPDDPLLKQLIRVGEKVGWNRRKMWEAGVQAPQMRALEYWGLLPKGKFEVTLPDGKTVRVSEHKKNILEALIETNGDIKKARQLLEKKGVNVKYSTLANTRWEHQSSFGVHVIKKGTHYLRLDPKRKKTYDIIMSEIQKGNVTIKDWTKILEKNGVSWDYSALVVFVRKLNEMGLLPKKYSQLKEPARIKVNGEELTKFEYHVLNAIREGERISADELKELIEKRTGRTYSEKFIIQTIYALKRKGLLPRDMQVFRTTITTKGGEKVSLTEREYETYQAVTNILSRGERLTVERVRLELAKKGKIITPEYVKTRLADLAKKGVYSEELSESVDIESARRVAAIRKRKTHKTRGFTKAEQFVYDAVNRIRGRNEKVTIESLRSELEKAGYPYSLSQGAIYHMWNSVKVKMNEIVPKKPLRVTEERRVVEYHNKMYSVTEEEEKALSVIREIEKGGKISLEEFMSGVGIKNPREAWALIRDLKEEGIPIPKVTVKEYKREAAVSVHEIPKDKTRGLSEIRLADGRVLYPHTWEYWIYEAMNHGHLKPSNIQKYIQQELGVAPSRSQISGIKRNLGKIKPSSDVAVQERGMDSIVEDIIRSTGETNPLKIYLSLPAEVRKKGSFDKIYRMVWYATKRATKPEALKKASLEDSVKYWISVGVRSSEDIYRLLPEEMRTKENLKKIKEIIEQEG